MSLSRRKLLQASGGMIGASSLAGCNYFSEDRYTTINIGNRTREALNVSVAALEPESDTRSSLWGENLELPAPEAESDTQRFEEAFESQRALIEVETIDMQQQFIYQPAPGCEDNKGDVLWIRFPNPDSTTWDVGCTSE